MQSKKANAESFVNKNLQIVAMFVKQLCSTKKHSDMAIVPTSVHFTRDLALVLPLNTFLNIR